ncbi:MULTISPECIES: hypothetical protein [unclassified Coleofasciculus]|uniref:hypothetical protein n=1 Tax=Cyanophyceae TaxID=3028117 RepID=UPI001F554BBD|nr:MULTISPECIES: hypothetical protein [unclassified Coleofasciculus]
MEPLQEPTKSGAKLKQFRQAYTADDNAARSQIHQTGKKIASSLLLSALAILTSCLVPLLTQAQTPPTLLPSPEPLDLKLLDPESRPPRSQVIRADSMSQAKPTVPSLWWAEEQFGGKLLENWLAYPDRQRVDLVVNRQLWSLLNYIGRYSFVNSFGTVARDYGYNTRVFIANQPQEPLATYTCNFSTTPVVCDLDIVSSGQDSLRVRSKPLGGFPATGNDTQAP